MTETERQETAAEEEESYLEGMAVVDFDMLCSTVAMQTHGKWTKLHTSDDHHHAAADAGVLRMWEGDLLDCFEDRRIAIESAWYLPIAFELFIYLLFFYIYYSLKIRFFAKQYSQGEKRIEKGRKKFAIFFIIII